MTHAPLIFAIVLSVASAAPDAPARQAAPEVGRADIAHAFLRFERAYLDSGSDGDRLAQLNREFDRLTQAIFFDRLDDALRRLEALSRALATSGPLDAPAPVLIARVEPPVVSHERNQRPTLTVASLDPMLTVPGLARIVLRAPDGAEAWTAPVPRAGPEPEPIGATLELPPARDLPLGRLSIEFIAPGAAPVERIGSVAVVSRPLSEVREEVIALLDGAEAEGSATGRDLGICRARAALLADDAPASSLVHTLGDPAALAEAVAAEARELARGQRPYKSRAGDLWRTIELRGLPVPMRLYAPPAVAGSTDPVPLVVALHGAGVDENMFMDAYGAGLIRTLADERGFLVAAPLTYPFMTSVDNLSTLIDDLALDYAIDRDRVYLIGHSLGAIAACGFVSADRPLVAAAACLAGFRPLVGEITPPPVLVIAAELDPIFPASRVRGAVEGARKSGLPVELVVVPNQGHTLVVPEALPRAVEFLLRHRLDH